MKRVVVRELDVLRKVILGEDPDPRFTVPRVHELKAIAIRFARTVYKPTRVPIPTRVNKDTRLNMHNVSNLEREGALFFRV